MPKLINAIKNLFKKKEEETYPPEFAVVVFNENAVNNGIEDKPNKIIIRYRANEKTEKIEVYKTYGYSDSLMHSLKTKLKIPIYDQTNKQIKIPIYSEIKLDELRYIK